MGVTVCTESRFLGALFDAWVAARVRFAVMRNWMALPATAGGSDLDVLVNGADAAAAAAGLASAIQACGCVALGTSATVGSSKTAVLGVTDQSNWWGLTIDMNYGLWFRGIRLTRSDFDPVVRHHQGVPILRDGIAAVLGTLKEVLHNDTLPGRYRAGAKHAAFSDWDPVAHILGPMGRPALQRLRDLLALAPEGPCRVAARGIRRALVWTSIRRGPLRFLAKRVRHGWSKLRRMCTPVGMVVAVMGVDGVGKSALVEAIKPILCAATHGACTVLHLRPGVLPHLSRLRGVGGRAVGQSSNPHAGSPSGPVASVVRLGWCMADYILGYWIRVRPRIAKQPSVVIFDRYAYDLGIDPRRFRIGLSPSVTARVARLAPRPDLTLCLHAPVDVVRRRKQELPGAELERQGTALRAFARHDSRAVLVSTDRPPGAVACDAMGHLVRSLSRRHQRGARGG